MSSPTCNECNRTGSGVVFNIFPPKPFKFGDLCVPCEKAATEGRRG